MEKYEPAISVDIETGEAHEIIIKKSISSQNFVKVFMADFLVALGILNSKSVSVVCYIFDNMNYSNNTLIATKEQIAKGSNTSVRTVYYVMRKLESKDFIKLKSPGVYVVNPKFIVKGNENKRRMILEYYNDDGNDENNDEPEAPASDETEE
ncbi:MAG: replication/maintenance protein RepL [Clostridia bacterium]|nr:replication/maintenance protein RepL [Clostridia bacterium]